MISPQDIEKLAALSRMELSDTEKTRFAKDIDSILAYVGQISEASGSVTPELPQVRNVFRADENPHESGIYSEALLSQAPAREGDYLKVKKILGGPSQ